MRKKRGNEKRMRSYKDSEIDYYEQDPRIQLPGMDTRIIFSTILNDSNKDENIFTTIQSIINFGKKELQEKKSFWVKKRNQLNVMNYSEEEFR